MNKVNKIILAPCSFKGSLSALEVCQHLEKGIKKALPTHQLEIISIPIADGGEGLVECLLATKSGKLIKPKVKDPLGREIESFYGLTEDNTAIIEMAAASGLPLLKKSERDPLKASTFGTGELILHALEAGCRKFVIGLGGSATVDCGHGMAKALGVRYFDKEGKEIEEMGGGCLDKIVKIDISALDKRISESEFTAACDVTNPLCGEKGASYVFGPQKGANKEQVELLDKNLRHFGELLEKVFNKELVNKQGSGAAGGLGAGLFAFLNGEFKKGIDIVKESSNFDEKVKGADLIITGEGGLDNQTLGGKALSGLLESAKKLNVPIIAIAGKLEDEEIFYEAGFKSLFSIVNKIMTEEEAMRDAGVLVEKAAERIVRLYF